MTAAELTARLCEWLERLFPDRDRGERLQAALRERFGGDERPVTGALCRELEGVAHGFARHLELEFVEAGGLVADADPPGWPPPDAAEIRARAGSVGEVRRVDGAGVLVLDGLDDVRLAGPYLEAAFDLLRGSRGIVLDLRRNGGGDPGTVMLVLEWLLGGAVAHISDVTYRERARQWWTTGRLAGRALPPDVPVAVLIGEGTYSSGESLAYHVQARGRARLVGGRTPGAADHVTPVRLGSHVRAVVPEACVRDTVTGGNWEGTGVVPDIACPPADALRLGLEQVLANRGRAV